MKHTYLKIKKFISKVYSDTLFRTELLLKTGLTLNFIYTFFGLFTGLFYRSVWFAGTAVYYILLCILKFYLLKKGFGIENKKTAATSELITGRNCGRMLLLLNVVILVLIYRMIEQNKGYEYSDTVLVGTATYTFVRLFAAVGDRIWLRKMKTPTVSAAKALSLTVAMMSLFSFQITLLDRLGTEAALRRGLNIITGATVGISGIFVALRLIKVTEKHLKKRKK